jgi:SNF2 family DNA or RNA helicase
MLTGSHTNIAIKDDTVFENSAAFKNKELVVQIHPDGFAFDWQNAANHPDDQNASIHNEVELYQLCQRDPYRALLRLGFSGQSEWQTDSVRFLGRIAKVFVQALAHNPDIESLREKAVIELEKEVVEQILPSAPYMIGAEYLNTSWAELVWHDLNAGFSREILQYEGNVAAYFAAQNPEIQPVGRVFFHLVESKEEDFPFAFLATYSSDVTTGGKAKHLPLKNALIEYKNHQGKLLELLSTVNLVASKSQFVSELVESGEVFHPIRLTSSEAYTFLREIPLYEQTGILCRIPNWWKNKSRSLKMSISVGENERSHLNMDAIINFEAKLSMGGESVTLEELHRLLSEAEGLAYIKGKWVEVNHEKLKETLRAYERAQKLMRQSEMTIAEAMRFQLTAAKEIHVAEDACELEITNDEWLHSLVSRMTDQNQLAEASGGEDFHASLRPYQEKGLSWLFTMKQLGIGACLADDMGLGKTVQVIALLNVIRSQKRDRSQKQNGYQKQSHSQKSERALLVVPASLIGNWANEISKFAPSLNYYVLHPSENKIAIQSDNQELANYDLLITTYGILQKMDWLREVHWQTLILDEAQAIKNPGTKQTRAVKQMQADYRIAMTGTPIENRLSDLWSLFDFLNKGLLGSTREFTNFTKQLKENPNGYTRLKKVVSPFILRRLKTDKTVIADLPDKIEMKTYTTLTKRQAALYNALVEEIKHKLEKADNGASNGIERKGLILSSIMKFKQICNHPDQYLGQALFSESESGKFARLRELCETIYEKRERVLIFTQFREITDPLCEFLENVFQHKGLVLHGGTPVMKRRELVERFQGEEYVPFMVLSIKAGGVGLNLTAANHVIHFDRWWNPAVENQATDRAFRIGQQKNVLVHKFVTKGTIEEKIDLLIEEKTKLSNEIVSDSQENWITELDNQQLLDLFSLSL